MSTSFILLVVLFNENFKKTVFNRNVNNINNYIIFLAQNYQLKILFSENYWCLKNEFKCVLNWIFWQLYFLCWNWKWWHLYFLFWKCLSEGATVSNPSFVFFLFPISSSLIFRIWSSLVWLSRQFSICCALFASHLVWSDSDILVFLSALIFLFPISSSLIFRILSSLVWLSRCDLTVSYLVWSVFFESCPIYSDFLVFLSVVIFSAFYLC